MDGKQGIEGNLFLGRRIDNPWNVKKEQQIWMDTFNNTQISASQHEH